MNKKNIGDIYVNGDYSEKNKGWHSEDSAYKFWFVKKIIEKNKIRFSSCADVGCGAGLVSEMLAEEYSKSSVIGYDLSADAAAYWNDRRLMPNLSFRNEDVASGGMRYDLVVCLDVFEHIEDFYGFLRSLRISGTNFVFNIPLDMNVIKLVTPGIRFAREEVGHLHYFSEYSAICTLRDCGYEVVDTNLSVAYLHGRPKNLRQLLVWPIRAISLVFGKRWAARIFGGISLVVYAR